MTVPYNWSGTIIPTNTAGGCFTPARMSIIKLVGNLTVQGPTFTWIPPPYIAGTVTHGGSAVEGVILTFSGVGSTTTTELGTYRMTVPYNWSGTVTPSSPTSGTFAPGIKTFSKVIVNKTGQNFTCSIASVLPMKRIAAIATVALAPVVFLSTHGTARWSGTNADQVRLAPELLSIAVNAGASTITLPIAVTEPADLSATVEIEPALQKVAGSAGDDAVIFRNTGGVVTTDTQLPGATVLGSATLAPMGDDMVLTWDLTVTGP